MQQREWMGQLVPYWHACVLGPVPRGQSERLQISIDYIFVQTLDEAIDSVAENVALFCKVYDHPVDWSEWDIAHVRIRNGS